MSAIKKTSPQTHFHPVAIKKQPFWIFIFKNMASLLNLLLLVLCTFTCICTSRADYTGLFCNQDTNITSNGQVSKNIDNLLAELVPNAISAGFAAASQGTGQYKVYGLAQCRGDLSSQDCSTCINDAAKQIRQLCPTQADARIWYDFCFLRHGPKNFFGEIDTSVGTLYANVENVTDPSSFKTKLGDLVDQIKAQSVTPSNKGLGKAKTKLSPLTTLYALIQCTRDLPPIACAQCLAIAVGNFEGFCDNKKGCRVLYSSCFVRYELYPFYFPLDSEKSTQKADHTSKVMVYS